LNNYSKILLRFSALFALLGVFLGSHMAGSGSYGFLTVHAHILVVGWLSLFAFSVYYKVFKPTKTILATIQVWTAIIGAIGLTSGMWFRYVGPFGIDTDGTFSLFSFIIGGTILLLSFLFFAILTFMKTDEEK
jgi:asparagine N-glycosylation enzyme membrane subunit Stt3